MHDVLRVCPTLAKSPQLSSCTTVFCGCCLQVGYVSSWSSYSSYLEANPGAGPDPVQEFQAALLKVLGTEVRALYLCPPVCLGFAVRTLIGVV